MVFVRCTFYYFIRGYEPDLVYKELTINQADGIGAKISKSTIHGCYAMAREVLGRSFNQRQRIGKMGGKGQEITIDVGRVNLKNKKGQKM